MLVHTHAHAHTYWLVPTHAHKQIYTHTPISWMCYRKHQLFLVLSLLWWFFFPFNGHKIIAKYNDSIKDLPHLLESEWVWWSTPLKPSDHPQERHMPRQSKHVSQENSITAFHSRSLDAVVVLERKAATGSSVWMLGHQLVELLGKD